MKKLLLILPVLCLSFNLQAQERDENKVDILLVVDSSDPIAITDPEPQFTEVEQWFLDIVVRGDVTEVIISINDGLVNFDSNPSLASKALEIAITNDALEMTLVLLNKGARLDAFANFTLMLQNRRLNIISNYQDYLESTNR